MPFVISEMSGVDSETGMLEQAQLSVDSAKGETHLGATQRFTWFDEPKVCLTYYFFCFVFYTVFPNLDFL